MPAPRAADRPPTATEGAPPPTPPDAVPTTVEELPAGFWDDDEPSAAPLPTADRAEVDADGDADGGAHASPTRARMASPEPAPPRPAPPAPPPADTSPAADRTLSPPALASLQGLALLQAVFPGRVVKVERTATTDDDAVPGESAAIGPLDATDDDPDPSADAPPPRTP